MKKHIIFRPALESDIPQLVELMNSQYARKKNTQYFLWQYFNSVWPTVLQIALVNNKLIGMFGLQKRKLNNRAIIGQAIDLLVTSHWRGKGIFKKLASRAIKHFSDLDALCVFPNLSGKIACEKGLGWKTLGRVNLMFFPRSNKDSLSKLRFSAKIKKLKPKQDFVKFKYDLKIREWRFNRHPEYKYFRAKIDSQTFAVVKLFRDLPERQYYGDIVDFECNLNDNTLRRLFLKASLYLMEQKPAIRGITTWALPHINLCKVLKVLGFIEVQKERYFCIKVLNSKYKNLYKFSNWHLVQADAEIY